MAQIGFDLDGVLYPLTREIDAYLSELGYSHDGQPTQWNLWEHYGITEAEWKYMFAKGIRQERLFVDGEPPESALGVLSEFLSDGHHLYVVTSRNIEMAELHARSATHRWIYEKLCIPWSGVIVSSNKAILPFYSFLDDHTENLENLRNSGILGVAFDQSWNQDWDRPRCTNLWQYYELITDSLENHESN